MDLANNLQGYKPEIMEDRDGGFTAINGKYKAVVGDFGRIKGETDSGWVYDFISLKFRITETVSGDKGDNRYMDKQFNLKETEYSSVEDGIKRFLDCMSTIAGKDIEPKIVIGDTDEEIIGKCILAAEECLGLVANITVYPKKYNKNHEQAGDIVHDKHGNPKHTVLVVAEFKTKKDPKAKEIIEDF